jgi:hypothetical protein
MAKRRLLSIGLLAPVLMLFVLFHCSINGPTVTVDAFAAENIDESYWQEDPHVTAFFYVACTIDDPDGIDDIIEVKMNGPDDDVWTLKDVDDDIDMFDDNGHLWHRFEASVPNRISIGEYVIVARDASGNEVSTGFSLGEPGSMNGTGFVYSDEYDGSTVGGKEMIKKAGVHNVIKDEDTITVEFTIDDERAFNGWIWFYDAGKTYISWSGFIKNLVNDGNGMYTDGSTNTLVLQRENLDIGTDEWNDMATLHFVVTDGEQFLPENTICNHLSISALYIFEF